MVIVANFILKEGYVFAGSKIAFSLHLLNVPKNILNESGSYHSNLITLFDEEQQQHPLKQIASNLSDLQQKTNENKTIIENNNSEDKQEEEKEEGGGLFSIFGSWFSSSSSSQAYKSEEDWTIESIYCQIYGLCVGDPNCLIQLPSNPIVIPNHQNNPNNKNSNSNNNNNQEPFNDEAFTKENQLKSLIPLKTNSSSIFSSRPKEIFSAFSSSSGGGASSSVNNKIKKEAILGLYESKKILVESEIPKEIPPSFKGILIKYNYYLSISISVYDRYNNKHTKVLTLPFKVHNPFTSICSSPSLFSEPFNFKWNIKEEDRSDDSGKKSSENIISFKESSSAYKYCHMLNCNYNNNNNVQLSNNITPFYYANEKILKIVSEQSKMSRYDIGDENDFVCRLSLSSTAFYIGDTILGLFDFTNGSKKCMKITCKLMYEEAIASWLVNKQFYKTKLLNESHNNNTLESFDTNYFCHLENKTTHIKVSRYDRHTLNSITTDFHMMIPPNAPSQFSSDYIKVNWFLKFKFFIIDQNLLENQNDRKKVLTMKFLEEKKESFEIKVLTWFLPIQVFVPPNFRPLHEHSQNKEQCATIYNV
ncbi:hypothetical protein ABK040_004028 [Willaertia magna]